MGDSIVDQQAIAAAKAEYESLGYNLSDIQMGYLVRIGLLMLGLAALGMVAAVLVGFIASRTAAKVGATLRSKLFRRVVSFSDAEVQSFSAASLITRGTNDIQLVQMVTVMLLRMVLYAPILAIGGMSAMEWRNRYLLLEAQELMERTDMSITAIAAKLGFSQPLGILQVLPHADEIAALGMAHREKKSRAQTGRKPIIATSNQQAIHAQTHAKCAISSAKFFVIKNV